MKIQDIKVGEVYRTTTATGYWQAGDYFRVEEIFGASDGPHVRANFNQQGFGQNVYGDGIWFVGEEEMEPIGPKPEPTPEPVFNESPHDTPEWERMGTAGARFAGYLTALSHLKAGEQGSYHAHKAMVDFLKHIGYEEVAELYGKFV